MKKERPADCCINPVAPAAIAASERERQVAGFRALGDPTRLEIFRLVAAQEAPIRVCDTVERFNVRQPTISHHLKILREAGLLTVSRRGIWAYYAVDPRGIAGLRDFLDRLGMDVTIATA